MSYRESVKKLIEDECKSLWEKIADAYEDGGEEAVARELSKKSKDILEKLKTLLHELERQL